MDLSVVTGTFNRLQYLQGFVESVRTSVLAPFTYEIVLVDGGSTDGTIEWCRAQPDVALVEHGELRGAVKAFNDGFAEAQGRYCVAGNDDVVFVDGSLTRAIAYMEDNPGVGQGCFYQKRGRFQHWHVEEMTAMREGRHVTAFYGQVAIVPKWLGDKVGWWGNVTRTYGGDNELSANIWEAGYTVVPIPGAQIVDQMAHDALRDANQGDPREMAMRGEHHPDTVLFYQKWPNGPTISDTPRWGLRDPGDVRVLYAPIIENQFETQVEQKRGLQEALNGVWRSHEFNYQLWVRDAGRDGMRTELLRRAGALQPHVILLQVHSATDIDAGVVQAARDRAPGVQVLNWNGDYHLDQLLDPAYESFIRELDVQCVVAAPWIPLIRELGVSAAYWQIGIEPDAVGHEPNGSTPHHNILFLANAYSPERLALGRYLRDMASSVGIYGMGWPDDMADGMTLYDFRESCRLMRAAKVCVSDQQWPEVEGYVSNRLFHTLAAGGGVLLQQRFAGMEEWLGVQEWKHMLCWETPEELQLKAGWALEEPEKAAAIAQEGQRFVLEHHSFEARVRELESIVIEGRRL